MHKKTNQTRDEVFGFREMAFRSPALGAPGRARSSKPHSGRPHQLTTNEGRGCRNKGCRLVGVGGWCCSGGHWGGSREFGKEAGQQGRASQDSHFVPPCSFQKGRRRVQTWPKIAGQQVAFARGTGRLPWQRTSALGISQRYPNDHRPVWLRFCPRRWLICCCSAGVYRWYKHTALPFRFCKRLPRCPWTLACHGKQILVGFRRAS